jgi:hypothetical protein
MINNSERNCTYLARTEQPPLLDGKSVRERRHKRGGDNGVTSRGGGGDA